MALELLALTARRTAQTFSHPEITALSRERLDPVSRILIFPKNSRKSRLSRLKFTRFFKPPPHPAIP
jgi:hypothetical protein